MPSQLSAGHYRAAVFAATSTHPGFLYLQNLRLLMLCVLLAMWFSSGLLLHTLSRIMMVVGWNLLVHGCYMIAEEWSYQSCNCQTSMLAGKCQTGALG